MTRVDVPAPGGAYRWYSADVVAGDVTALFTFMVGSIFSGRYAGSHKKGGAPREHAAVHFALYEQGVRVAWLVSEYQPVSIEEDGRTLRLGRSTLRYRDGGFSMSVTGAPAGWGEALEARLDVTAAAPPGDEAAVVVGQRHRWQPLCLRGAALLSVPSLELSREGLCVHDRHAGDVPLGSGGLGGWDQVRTHRGERSDVRLRPWGAPALVAELAAGRVSVSRRDEDGPRQRSSWGLSVPKGLGLGGAPTALESSPFYARLEASDGGGHAFAEVSDFARFHGTSGAAGAVGKAES